MALVALCKHFRLGFPSSRCVRQGFAATGKHLQRSVRIIQTSGHGAQSVQEGRGRTSSAQEGWVASPGQAGAPAQVCTCCKRCRNTPEGDAPRQKGAAGHHETCTVQEFFLKYWPIFCSWRAPPSPERSTGGQRQLQGHGAAGESLLPSLPSPLGTRLCPDKHGDPGWRPGPLLQGCSEVGQLGKGRLRSSSSIVSLIGLRSEAAAGASCFISVLSPAAAVSVLVQPALWWPHRAVCCGIRNAAVGFSFSSRPAHLLNYLGEQ